MFVKIIKGRGYLGFFVIHLNAFNEKWGQHDLMKNSM